MKTHEFHFYSSFFLALAWKRFSVTIHFGLEEVSVTTYLEIRSFTSVKFKRKMLGI